MPGLDSTTLPTLDLSPEERRETEREIWHLKSTAAVPIGMAPGYYSPAPFFPCGPLELQEFNLDYQGNLTLCCHLSGYETGGKGADVIGNLRTMSLDEACLRFEEKVRTYLADKKERVKKGEFGELDYFPCYYCVRYLNKIPHVPTSTLNKETHHDFIAAADAASS
jgi:hypothetical protein